MRSISFLFSLILCLPVCITQVLQAQKVIRLAEPVELSIEEIGVTQGLSQGMIHGLGVDRKGYLWIATKDGLNRYDGNHFYVFHHDPHDVNSIASNYIWSLHIDDHGFIWAGTNDSGLDLYDPVKSRFIHFGNSIDHAASTILSVAKILSDPSGRIMIWNGAGEQSEILTPVAGQDPYSIHGWKIESLKEVYPAISKLPGPNVYNIVGYGDDGALFYNNEQKLYAVYSDHIKELTPPDASQHDANHEVGQASIKSYFIDDQHHLYCVFPQKGIISKWDADAAMFVPWIKLPEGGLKMYTRFVVDHRGHLWCNGSKVPMLRIDIEQGIAHQTSVTRFHSVGTHPTDYSIMCEDPQHNLWAGTSGNGIIKISSRNDQFIRLSGQAEQNFGIRVVRDGFSFRIHDNYIIANESDLQKRFAKSHLLRVSSYAEDASHQLWCIAGGERVADTIYLIRIDPKNNSFSSWPLAFCPQFIGESEPSLMFDRTGVLWIATECMDGTAHLIRVHDPNVPTEEFNFPVQVIHNEHPFITDWYVDKQNVFWIGTKQGLFAFNPATVKWKHFHVEPTRSDGLSNNHILSICPDPGSPEKYLWIGTDGGGLNRMDMTEETFQYYTTDNGLPNNVIYAVQSDQHQKLWLSSNLGLSRFDPVTDSVWSFTIEDGLPGNEFNRMEYGKTTDGRLYFGGIEGMTIFNPEVFYRPSEASPIVINRLKLSNKEVFYSSLYDDESKQDYMLPAPLEQCTRLTFSYAQRMITLGFSLLDFTNPDGNEYRYRMTGVNNEWIDAGEVNEAVFTNLNPGTYTFMVSGRNSNNIWSDPVSLQVIILSPWWSTWWFRSLIVLSIAFCVYAFYQYRLQQAIKLQDLRNRIAADLHDEIGSTLSSISLAGTVIQHKLKDANPEVNGLLDKINHSTQSMMEAMSDIVWAVNTKNDRFDQVLHRMRAFAAEILEPGEVIVQFEVSPLVIPLQLDMQQRKNLYLLFKEVIHNAAKYAHCNNVWVHLNYAHGMLMMEVRDDGVGFVVEHMKGAPGNEVDTYSSDQKMGGNGIQNMYQRALELNGELKIDSSPGKGTMIKLGFPV